MLFAVCLILSNSFASLLPDRKLKTLFQRPLNHLPDSKDGYSLLLFWHWEECLKERYMLFIIIIIIIIIFTRFLMMHASIL